MDLWCLKATKDLNTYTFYLESLQISSMFYQIVPSFINKLASNIIPKKWFLKLALKMIMEYGLKFPRMKF